jgi:SAM-dependent methyltransferase
MQGQARKTTMHRHLREANRLSWNAATRAHNSHKGDQAAFFRAGGSTLRDEERALLGDLTNKQVVHLLCNAGQDTLSLVQQGASAVGVDISDEAIAFARQLARASGLPATFERADIFDWLTAAARQHRTFDLVYSSYGAVHWIADLHAWLRGIAAILHPGGRFVVVDFHPMTYMFDRDWQHVHSYFRAENINHMPAGVLDYVARDKGITSPFPYQAGIEDFTNPHPSHMFLWTMGDIITAIGSAGLRTEILQEYPHTIGHRFNRMRELSPGKLLPPEAIPTFPLLYGLVARKS